MPYTYSELCSYLLDIEQRELKYVSRNTLCRTLAGNKCEYLTISNRTCLEKEKKKQAVVITGRIHPGESNSSWKVKGLIDFLISDDPTANDLRDKFVFKVIPMLNPDGVINGNYRCSLAGCDLNRRWKFPSEALHPTVYHAKKLIKKCESERPLALYLDMHGHSRRKNAFIYGNEMPGNEEAPRILPFLISKFTQPLYSYDQSRFQVSRSKEHTARISVWRELGEKHPNIFTLESSFCGPEVVKYEPNRGGITYSPMLTKINFHFTTKDYAAIGKGVC